MGYLVMIPSHKIARYFSENSSEVERSAHNAEVDGSSPSLASQRLVSASVRRDRRRILESGLHDYPYAVRWTASYPVRWGSIPHAGIRPLKGFINSR